MWAAPEVLILEDDPEQLATVERAVRDAHLEPLAAPNPRRALTFLDHRDPLLAILDLDMSRVAHAERRVEVGDVLRRLRRTHVNCIPLVYSANVETIDAQAQVYATHPQCLFQSKRHGVSRLLDRIGGLLSGRVGDLAIREGVVVHLPSGETATHRVAVSLLAARRANRSLVLRDSDARAARRFAEWLGERGSSVQLRALGNRHYRLALREAPEGPGRAAPPADGASP
jgi:CheY-like chemotaxis protein